MPGSIGRKIILARAIVGNPRLLVLDDFLLGVERREKQRIIDELLKSTFAWTIIIVSNDPMIMQRCNRVVFLHRGTIHADGPYAEVCKHDRFSDLVLKQFA